jgi:hypothetical protein
MSEKPNMTDDPSPPDREERPLNRWDCPGVYLIGDRVIWDGEAEYLGLEPLTRWPPVQIKAPKP